MSVVDRLQLHAVIVDHAEGGDRFAAALYELEGVFSAIDGLVLIHGHRSAVHCNGVIFPDLLQVRKVCDNRCPLAAVCQVDKVRNIIQPQLVGHGLKLTDLAGAEAVQPFRQVVQLIYIHQRTLDRIQHKVAAVDLVHFAVPIYGKAQVDCLKHLNGLIILVDGNGEGDGNLTAFRVLGIA